VSLGVRPSRCHAVCVSAALVCGEGNALYPVLSSLFLCGERMQSCENYWDWNQFFVFGHDALFRFCPSVLENAGLTLGRFTVVATQASY